MFKSFACLIILCLPVVSYAQRNYQPGYIVSLSGDTTSGFINYQDWVYSPKGIEFRHVPEGETKQLGASTIRSFTVLGRVYRGAIVDIETSAINIDKLDDTPVLHLVKDTVFLSPVFHETKSLYHYYHQQKEYFYIEKGATFELLLFKRYIQKVGSSQRIISNKLYVAQLSKYFDDCPAILRKLKHVSYTLMGLRDIFLKYYACTGTEPVFFKETRTKNHLTSEFAILAGAGVNVIAFKGEYAEMGKADYDPAVSFTGGVSWNVFRRDRQKFKLINQLVFSRCKMTASYYNRNEYGYERSENKFTASNIHWTTLFRYTLPVDEISYFGNLGGGIGFSSLSPNNRVYERKYNYDLDKESNGPGFESDFLFGECVAGIGATRDHLSLELRYAISSGPAVGNLTSLISTMSLLLHYRF